MALARDAYALAGKLSSRNLEAARALRRSAVSVPARLAGALSGEETKRREELLGALGALADVARFAETAGTEGEVELAPDLARRAEALDRAVLAAFEEAARELTS
jgi:hypothetical protein